MKNKNIHEITLLMLLVGSVVFAFKIDIEPVKALIGTIYIRADGSIDPPTAPIFSSDKNTYTFTDNIYDEIVVERDNIVIDGAGYILQGTGSGTGIDLSGRTNVTVRNTQINSFLYGVALEYSSGNIISGNNITNNSDYGIQLHSSSKNIISGNNIKNNWGGVRLCDSSGNIVSGNNITNNSLEGVDLDSSSDNSISENNITANNNCGIKLVYSSDNRFYHNNVIDNGVQVYSTGSINVWDDGYPSGGNYWSDYTSRYPNARELDGTGLWDTPYVIDGNNIDYYPLMYPYGTLTYKLTITSSSGGNTAPEPGTHTYANGTVVSITAIPNVGYSFDYWLLDDEKRIENPITITMIKNYTLAAYFIDDIPPELSEPWQDPPPENVQPFQSVTVWVNVTDYGTGIKNVTLWYSLNNGTNWIMVNMTELPIPSDMTITYKATIQGYENSTWITYKIVAYDNAGNNATKDNNRYYYKYHVIPEFPSSVALLGFSMLITIPLVFTKRKCRQKINS